MRFVAYGAGYLQDLFEAAPCRELRLLDAGEDRAHADEQLRALLGR